VDNVQAFKILFMDSLLFFAGCLFELFPIMFEGGSPWGGGVKRWREAHKRSQRLLNMLVCEAKAQKKLCRRGSLDPPPDDIDF